LYSFDSTDYIGVGANVINNLGAYNKTAGTGASSIAPVYSTTPAPSMCKQAAGALSREDLEAVNSWLH
jgi:hypothetical protein